MPYYMCSQACSCLWCLQGQARVSTSWNFRVGAADTRPCKQSSHKLFFRILFVKLHICSKERVCDKLRKHKSNVLTCPDLQSTAAVLLEIALRTSVCADGRHFLGGVEVGCGCNRTSSDNKGPWERYIYSVCVWSCSRRLGRHYGMIH